MGRAGIRRGGYSHLLGLYLGDGCISHMARTTVLRIFFDAAYPRLIAEAVGDVRRVRPGANVHVIRRVPTRCVVVGSMWKRWPELFPQDGPGRKHERPIFLADWQRAVQVCESRHREGREHAYPNYGSTNVSEDIRRSFASTSISLASHGDERTPNNIAMTRRSAVARLDEFVGPKR